MDKSGKAQATTAHSPAWWAIYRAMTWEAVRATGGAENLISTIQRWAEEDQ